MKLWPSRYQYDAFIIHAIEDRETITRKLCDGLTDANVNIWYSGKDLRVGSLLLDEIIRGLGKSRYGIIILSRDSINSAWVRHELFELLSRANNTKRKTILPVLHGITMDELEKLIMVPSTIWSTSSSKGIDKIVNELTREINARPVSLRDWILENSYALKIWSTAALFVMALGLWTIYYHISRPPESLVRAEIETSVINFQGQIIQYHELDKRTTLPASIDAVKNLYNDFTSLDSHYKNEYKFTNSKQTLNSLKRIKEALGIDLTAQSPMNTYNLENPEIYCFVDEQNNKISAVKYLLLNTEPVSYVLADCELVGEGRYEVNVDFKKNIRYIVVNLTYPTAQDVRKRHSVSMQGFLPREKYTFIKEQGVWRLFGN